VGKWVIMPNFKDKSNRSLLTSVKKFAGSFNAINLDSKIQIVPLSFLDAASRLFYLNSELLSRGIEIGNIPLGDQCLKEVTTNLAKEFPFLCLGLDCHDFCSDPIFAIKFMPITGVFAPRSEGCEDSFIPDTQLVVEDKLVRQLVPLWQPSANLDSPLELTVCGRQTNFTSYHFIDPTNTQLKIGPDRSATERSNLNYIEPSYLFKDKLLR